MSRQFNVAILGAAGAVGSSMIELLEERQFPINELYLLGSERSAGEIVRFQGKSITIQNVNDFDWRQVEIGIFSAGGAVSRHWAPIAAEYGVVVIDNTSEFRYEPDIPLVVPEVNPSALADFRNRNIIANPNCSTIQMLVALKPIYDAVGISRINVSTYQAVSGAGKSGIDALAQQTAKLLNAKPIEETQPFGHQIAFNCIPQIDQFMENGYTREEMKMVWETQKILGDDSVEVNPTCVRVPVFYGHAEAVHLETLQQTSRAEVLSLLSQAEGIELYEDEQSYPTQVGDASGQDAVYVGRVREDISHPHGINLWVVSDNVRKGAALNSIQIAELLIENYL